MAEAASAPLPESATPTPVELVHPAAAPAAGAATADVPGDGQAAVPQPEPQQQLEPGYRLKHVAIRGRSVPVVMQSENGPCPLLAIANVLLLRNQIHLPGGASEVSQVRRPRAQA